ncbi:MAG TPA: tRNA modification GTPase, partial [Flavobacteriaceae bacterium]|nr:tRNA modification GTPase [Flavobacteriaceae bacterium]
MHKKILIYFILLIGYNSYSQSDFEKGYIINNSDNKTSCLIRVSDWFSSPINFEYKLTEESKPIKITTKSIKEFSSLNNFKYERQTVDIDRSSDQIKKLNYDNTPKFIEETLFLEVLVEGKATLYKYEEGNLIRYFFKTENQQIEQLIYKRYKSTINSSIKENNQFKQQLYTSLSTSNRSVSSFENIDYTQRDLLKIFEEFNNESGSDYTSYN